MQQFSNIKPFRIQVLRETRKKVPFSFFTQTQGTVPALSSQSDLFWKSNKTGTLKMSVI